LKLIIKCNKKQSDKMKCVEGGEEEEEEEEETVAKKQLVRK